MASIKSIYQCPRCDENITTEKGRPKSCPSCGYEFSDPILGFKYPLTLTEQAEKLNKDTAHYQAIIEMPLDKANSIMNDALNIIELIPGKIVERSDIRQLMGMAIKIGKIAEAYESFLSGGGHHVPSLFLEKDKTSSQSSLQTIVGEKHESKQTADGGNAT